MGRITADLRILGADDRELPAGVTGEIVGFGPLLMQGYYGRDEASREATWTDGEDGAGCAPGTWDSWTRTASCTLSTARRT